MTSRERVRKILNYEEADRVPIDIGGTTATSFCIDEYIEVKKHLGYKQELSKVNEQFMMLARIEEPIRIRLHSDVIQLENPEGAWGLENKDWKTWKTGLGNNVLMPSGFDTTIDEKGYTCVLDVDGKTIARMPPNGLYFERNCGTSMSENITKMDPDKWKESIPLYSERHLRQLEEEARRLYENTEYSIHGAFRKGSLTSHGIFAGHTITDWLCVLLLEPDYAYSIVRATAERAVENLELYIQAVGKYVDSIMISGFDYGTQNQEFFNPDIFKDIYLPNIKYVNDYVHNSCKAKTFYHSCGSIWNLIEYLIDGGVDILNPIQTTAANMEPEKLKENFGGRIVFWGAGVDSQTVLPYGSTEDVRIQTKERLKIFAPGGGFVFAPIHNIQYGVPPENIITMVDTAFEYGNYLMKSK